MPLARRVAATAAASIDVVEVDGADHQRAVRPGRRRTAWCTTSSRPSRRARRSDAVVRSTMPVEAALAVHPVQLLGHQEERRDRRGVVGLVRAASCRSRSAGRGTPGCGGRSPRSPSARSSAAGDISAMPEAAVGGEALLRREVVDVGLGQVDRQAAGARGGVDQHQRVVVGARRAAYRRHHGGRGLVVRPGVDVDARPRRPATGRRAGLARDDRRVGQPRRGRRRPWRTSRRTRRRSGAGSSRGSGRSVATSQNAVAPPLPSTTS